VLIIPDERLDPVLRQAVSRHTALVTKRETPASGTRLEMAFEQCTFSGPICTVLGFYQSGNGSFLFAVLGFELKASHLQGRGSTPSAMPPALFALVIFDIGFSLLSQAGLDHNPPFYAST
jgi:hypothetical protein